MLENELPRHLTEYFDDYLDILSTLEHYRGVGKGSRNVVVCPSLIYEVHKQVCDSELEFDFLRVAVRRFDMDQIRIMQQVVVGRYRIDFTLEDPFRRIGIELDGKRFHDTSRDFFRDQEILKSGFVSAIVRIPFRAMWYYREAIPDLISAKFPWIVRNQRHTGLSISLSEFRTMVSESEWWNQFGSKEEFVAGNDCYQVFDANPHHNVGIADSYIGSPTMFYFHWKGGPIRIPVIAEPGFISMKTEYDSFYPRLDGKTGD